MQSSVIFAEYIIIFRVSSFKQVCIYYHLCIYKQNWTVLGPTNEKQVAVVEAFKHSWKAYKEHAWGKDQLKPISKTFHTWFDLGLTLVDSLDTMYIMGLTEGKWLWLLLIECK